MGTKQKSELSKTAAQGKRFAIVAARYKEDRTLGALILIAS